MSTSLSLLLDKLYQLCLRGGYGLASAYILAEEHKTHYPSYSDSLDKLIKQEANKATMTGFVTGLGGIVSLPVMLPANAVSSLFIQMRLVATIAILQGHDVHDERIKILMYFSLCAMSGKAKLQQLCLKALMKESHETVKQLSLTVTKQLVTSLSTKHMVKFIKVIPLLGGVTGAVIDRIVTYRVGQFAKQQFTH